MTHYVTEEYIAWLKKFRKANETDKRCVQVSTKLIADLKTIESTDALNNLMASHLTKPSENSIHQYMPTIFYRQLSGWQDYLVTLGQTCQTAQTILNNIDPTNQNPLVQLLSEILDNKKARLNDRTTSVLAIVHSERFPELIGYLATLPYAPYPTNAKEGDFAAIQPINDYHKTCLIMLNNVATSASSHPCWNFGNGLLQSSLLIYLDMYMEEINLNDTDDFVPPPEEGGCILF